MAYSKDSTNCISGLRVLTYYVRGLADGKSQEFENSQRVWPEDVREYKRGKAIEQNTFLIVSIYYKVDGIVFHLKLLLTSVRKRNLLESNNVRVLVPGTINVCLIVMKLRLTVLRLLLLRLFLHPAPSLLPPHHFLILIHPTTFSF